jgi:iron complex transport system permease protein
MDARMHPRTLFLLLACSGLVLLLVTPFVGIVRVPWAALWDAGAYPSEHRLFWLLRVPRVLTAFLAGSALALSGMSFQALFRNALATPYTLGVSSGAALGVALCVQLGVGVGLGGYSVQSLAALGGAALAIALVYGLTRWRGGCSSATMLLAGVAVSTTFSSLILFVQYTSDFANSFRIVRWLMGGVATTGYQSVIPLAVLAGAGMVVAIAYLRELDLLSVGEEFAASRGVAVNRSKLVVFLGVSLMVGGVVAVCGPIGFVGMVCPHLCRLLSGGTHRNLAPATFLFGGSFLLLCDTVSRVLVAPAEIPVGVITALLGGPFFLWLLFRRAAPEL